MLEYKKSTYIKLVKNADYMCRKLEIENASLKVEVYQLKKEIEKMYKDFIDEIKEFKNMIDN